MTDRTQGILNRASEAEKFSGVRWILGDGVITNYMQSFVDETMKRNAEFQSRAGVSPKIVRKSPTKCCPWCDALVGEYKYPDDVPDDVYRRHDNCNCIVEFYPGDGTKQDVWSKEWADQDEEILEERKRVGRTPKRQKVKKAKPVADNSGNAIKHDGKTLYSVNGVQSADAVASTARYRQGKGFDGLRVNMDGAKATIDEILAVIRDEAKLESPFDIYFISMNDKAVLQHVIL